MREASAFLRGVGFDLKTATEIGSRVRGRLPSFVRCRGRIEVCGIRIPAQAANWTSDRMRGGRPRAEVRLRAPCCIGRHAKARPYQGRVHRARIEPHARRANGICFRADDRVAL